MSWFWFAVMMLAILVAGVVLWRRWRRWNPVQGTSPEARRAEAELWSTRNMNGPGGF